jgi:hypothetical protein
MKVKTTSLGSRPARQPGGRQPSAHPVNHPALSARATTAVAPLAESPEPKAFSAAQTSSFAFFFTRASPSKRDLPPCAPRKFLAKKDLTK